MREVGQIKKAESEKLGQTVTERGKDRDCEKIKNQTGRARKKKDTCTGYTREKILLQQESKEQILCEVSVLAGTKTGKIYQLNKQCNEEQ